MNYSSDVLIIVEIPTQTSNGFHGFASSKLKTLVTKSGLGAFRPIYAYFPERQDINKDLTTLIQQTKPRVIVAVGASALYGLTSLYKNEQNGLTPTKLIQKFRGSELRRSRDDPWIVPTYGFKHLQTTPEDDWIVQKDLARAVSCITKTCHQPLQYTIATSLAQVTAFLERALHEGGLVAADVETRRNQIDCIGFAHNNHAICIPFFRYDGSSYWTLDDEGSIIHSILTIGKKLSIVGQNWAYDSMMMHQNWGHYLIPEHDTTVLQHTCWAGTQKDLAFLASIYCKDYTNWKGALSVSAETGNDHARWIYNAQDCLVTLEVCNALLKEQKLRQTETIYKHEMALWLPVLQMTLQGIRVDRTERQRIIKALKIIIKKLQTEIHAVVGWPINLNSQPQMKRFFIATIGLKPVTTRQTKGPSFSDDALNTYKKQCPRLAPLFEAIMEHRSLQTTLKHLQSELSADGRMRASFNITGNILGRISSSKTLYGEGLNFQNIIKHEA